MIAKIKELMRLKDNVEGLNQQLMQHELTVQSLNQRIDEFKQSLERMNADTEKLTGSIRKDIEALASFQEQLEQELYTFKLTQKEMRDHFHKQMAEEVGWLKGVMQKDISEFNDVKKKIDTKFQTMDKLDSEVQRLTSIAKGIRAQDFELVRFQKELQRTNSEKLVLLKKIDTLERMVAKMRRGR